MKSDFSSTEMHVGAEAINALRGAKVLVAGVGGVGGYAVEALARAGVGNIAILDSDNLHSSNINRQILSTADTIDR
ncbi:MAG: ThiF family adenylyltransferase [Clostridia bacterium]|nr:ThiF family adenylyltransferase [Clostridia bacterium]